MALAVAVALVAAAGPSKALTISPFFDDSITKAGDAAAIEASINDAIKFYDQTYNNDVTVKIVFKLGDVKIGQTVATVYGKSYAIYAGKLLPDDLKANPQNKVLETAIPNLKWGNKPKQGKFVIETSADFRALGVTANVGLYGKNGVFGDGDYDGVITLSDQMVKSGKKMVGKLAYGKTVLPEQYAANFVIQHEIDEVLGIGHQGSLVGDTEPKFEGSIEGLDLYRYKAEHEPSFSTSRFAKAYFSIDGGKSPLINFNQVITSDTGDWADIDCKDKQYVQGAFACPGPTEASLTLAKDSVESVALQAIGYNLVPEPSTWALLLAGFAGLGSALRGRRRASLGSVHANPPGWRHT